MEQKTALVLGATGGIGGEVARRLASSGWQVRALHRRAAAPADAAGFSWIRGDAMMAHDVAAAAQGASLIVHAVNPPGYRDWGKVVLPMLDNSIAAARGNKARILLPGTVYNYGPDAFPDIGEEAPQHPLTRKGAIRAEMERRLRAFAASGEGSVLIVRAGDFFGPRAANNWFGQGLVKPGARPRAITYPGAPGVGHQWAYLPDVGETMVRLLGLPLLDPFATFHMEGHWDPDGTRMVEASRKALGSPNLPVRRLPWLALRLASPFSPFLRELTELKYLWDQPVRLRNERLLQALGEEPRTTLDVAVAETLAGLGCLPTEPEGKTSCSSRGPSRSSGAQMNRTALLARE
jgi:nucleoside-diphosphate-sugar epimerase